MEIKELAHDHNNDHQQDQTEEDNGIAQNCNNSCVLATQKWLYGRERLELSVVRKTKMSHICFDVQEAAGYNQETVPSALSLSAV